VNEDDERVSESEKKGRNDFTKNKGLFGVVSCGKWLKQME
jgi:hypothetical protein